MTSPRGEDISDPGTPLPAFAPPDHTAHPRLAAVLLDVRRRADDEDGTVAQYEDAP
ncbi:hypothetical protein ACIREE_02410 [Streptomyces sp. NPDC102467]|uniref:hypothetical protein n=1 Tax=Streptomyces sp. NPDC102467 TaxID=3366179 RepID=UPI0037F36944